MAKKTTVNKNKKRRGSKRDAGEWLDRSTWLCLSEQEGTGHDEHGQPVKLQPSGTPYRKSSTQLVL